MIRIYKEFSFEAAHFLPSAAEGHPNSRVHGHSFLVRVSIKGEVDPASGLIVHFDEVDAALKALKDTLDHRFLNEIEGLEQPTLERLARWMWTRLKPALPGLYEIEVSRPSCAEGCVLTEPAS